MATQLLLAENANIAGFIFKNNKLVSQQNGTDGKPMLSLDGVNGEITAYKGIWKGSIWYDFVHVNAGSTLDPLKPNVVLEQSVSYDNFVYLPDITDDIIGCCFNLYWNGLGTRSNVDVQKVKSRSRNIIDFDDIGSYGRPSLKQSINYDYFKYGFLQIFCVDRNYWVISFKTSSNLVLE